MARSRRSAITDMDVFTPMEVRETANLIRARIPRYPDDALVLLVWNLTTCCGLRASEVAGVRIGDLVLSAKGRVRPHLFIDTDVAKRGGGVKRARRVPLTWVPWLLADLQAWMERRRTVEPAGDSALLAVRLGGVWRGRMVWAPGRRGRVWQPDRELAGCSLDRRSVRDLFLRACSIGRIQGRRCTTHVGRHTFATNALAAGFPLANVRDALGHSDVATTSIYSHAVDTLKLDARLYAEEGEARGN